ncbi:acyl carrier protein [Aquabacterium sp.]|uniref:acyl carrier protein n=1 Tax=Aquabacterium sp. TaxID=1872578 RepID=UPI00403761A3
MNELAVAAVKQQLFRILAPAVKIPVGSIDPHKTFVEMGLDSLDLVTMSGDLEEALGIVLDPIIAYKYNTIEALACYLASVKQPEDAGA